MKSGFAFVYFEDEQVLKTLSIASIIRHLDMTGAGYLWNGLRRGRHHDGSKSLANQSPTKSLLVIIFDPVHTQIRDIERHVEPYGKVLHVRIRRNLAFVHLCSLTHRKKALQATHLSKILDRIVSVEYALRDDSERGDRYRVRRGSYGRRGDSPYWKSPSPGCRRRPIPDYGRPCSPVCDRYNGPVYDRRKSHEHGRNASPAYGR